MNYRTKSKSNTYLLSRVRLIIFINTENTYLQFTWRLQCWIEVKPVFFLNTDKSNINIKIFKKKLNQGRSHRLLQFIVIKNFTIFNAQNTEKHRLNGDLNSRLEHEPQMLLFLNSTITLHIIKMVMDKRDTCIQIDSPNVTNMINKLASEKNPHDELTTTLSAIKPGSITGTKAPYCRHFAHTYPIFMFN